MTLAEYNQCVESFSSNLYRFILKNLRNEEKAKDVVQDTFTKLWIKVDDVDFEKAKSYIFTTGYRTMIDLVRKDKRRETKDSWENLEPSHSEHYTDLQEILDQALNQLPESQKNVILLRDYEGYSYKEIGDITGLNEAQVKVYIYRARVTLKNYLVKMENVI